jgi:hypothetical protein
MTAEREIPVPTSANAATDRSRDNADLDDRPTRDHEDTRATNALLKPASTMPKNTTPRRINAYFVPLLASSMAACWPSSTPEPACLDSQSRVVSCDTAGAVFVPVDMTCQDAEGSAHPIEDCQAQAAEVADTTAMANEGSGATTQRMRSGYVPLFFFWGAGGGTRYSTMRGYPRVPYTPQYRSSAPASYMRGAAPSANPRAGMAPPPRSTRTGFGRSGRGSFGGG